MNQTQKRLQIIKLAISITDIETIQLQLLKLAPLKTDAEVQEILTLLQAGNYAQAQGLITQYLESSHDEIIQRTSQDTLSQLSPEEQQIVEEFKLFVTPTQEEEKPTKIDIHEYAPIEQHPPLQPAKESHYDALLNLEADDVLSDNTLLDDTSSFQENEEEKEDTFFSQNITSDSEEISHLDTKDTFFDDVPEVPNNPKETSDMQNGTSDTDTTTLHKDNASQEEELTLDTSEEESSLSYAAITHISQKFISMKKRYPLIQSNHEEFDTVESLIQKIAHDGYTEDEIEEMINYIQKLVDKKSYTEAAQLLLVCAATESKFAQFMLARELYKGAIFKKNIPESFDIMNQLAIEDYPEALCDLGQFYEHGIGTTPDLVKAERLYKEAVNLGIKRAKKHYNRLKKLNRSFF